MPQAFANHYIGRLDRQGIERPEAAFRQPQQRPGTEPAHCRQRQQQQGRPDLGERYRRLGPYRGDPDRNEKRRRPKQQAREADQQHPDDDELRQADLRQQAAGQRDQRSPLGAGRIVLDVAISRIDYRRHYRASTRHRRPISFACQRARQRAPRTWPKTRRCRAASGKHGRTGERRQAPPARVDGPGRTCGLASGDVESDAAFDARRRKATCGSLGAQGRSPPILSAYRSQRSAVV